MREITGALAETGDVEQAVAVVNQSNDTDTALYLIAYALAKVGDTKQAYTVANQITNPYQKSRALRRFAVVLARAGDAKRALAVAPIEDTHINEDSMCSIAWMLAVQDGKMKRLFSSKEKQFAKAILAASLK